jgi:hypothetical protein
MAANTVPAARTAPAARLGDVALRDLGLLLGALALARLAVPFETSAAR